VVTWGVAMSAQASMPRSNSRVERCGYLRASVPYSHNGNRDRWGVYALGAATCRRAGLILSGVMHLRGSTHLGRDDAHSYFSYQGWRCDFGDMGTQACWTPSARPFRAQGLALNCDDQPDGGCPRAIPRAYFG
jgi:hypothetical protein